LAESTRRTYLRRLDHELNAVMALAPTNRDGRRLQKHYGKYYMSFSNPPAAQLLKRNLREQLVEQLSGDIVRGRPLPGEPLPNEEELLSRYHVSRTVLREALNVLSGKGLLDVKPRRGTKPRGALGFPSGSLSSFRLG
jgi:hypothetical protein